MYLRCLFFFFNDTATTEIYTLSLHDALPICGGSSCCWWRRVRTQRRQRPRSMGQSAWARVPSATRSEEHTSELQSQSNLVCRLLLEKKKKQQNTHQTTPDDQQRITALVTRLR